MIARLLDHYIVAIITIKTCYIDMIHFRDVDISILMIVSSRQFRMLFKYLKIYINGKRYMLFQNDTWSRWEYIIPNVSLLEYYHSIPKYWIVVTITCPPFTIHYYNKTNLSSGSLYIYIYIYSLSDRDRWPDDVTIPLKPPCRHNRMLFVILW